MVTKQIHLEVPAKQHRFMLKLLEALPFVRISAGPTATHSPTQEETINHIEQGFKELKLMQEGKLKSRLVEELFDELLN
jgi:hypothetical protein